MEKITIYNHKGGVAKTTSVINIAYAMHKAGKKVLVVDCDTQENCYSFFLTSRNTAKVLPTAYENIEHTTWASYSELENEELENYDFILFDLPPAMSNEV
jgi:cellulose biosynthesis protein BcsQ